MSDSPLILIADAVVAAINAASVDDWDFVSLLTSPAQRILDTELRLEDALTLHVDVVPGNIKSEIGTRDSQRGEYTVDIAVRKKCTAADIATADALFALENEIDRYLFGLQRLPTLQDAAWLSSNPRYPYVPDQLRNIPQFTGILAVTYLLWD